MTGAAIANARIRRKFIEAIGGWICECEKEVREREVARADLDRD